MDKTDFTRYLTVYRHYSDKKVKSVELKLSAKNMEKGEIHVTDLQLQEGAEVTGQVPATSDMMINEKFTIDEFHNAVGFGYENIYEGEQPEIFKDMKNRFFNVMGRGFETITIPNVYHEDYRKEILTTGLDLTLYPKNDYDFLRVSSFYGGFVDENITYQNENLANNDLNKRYTREFCFRGGKLGDEIKISASGYYATVNGNKVDFGIQHFDVGQESDYDGVYTVQYENRQRFLALPIGATRVKIEFMKRKQEGDLIYMVDGGIGFYGIAEFTQWTWGASKL